MQEIFCHGKCYRSGLACLLGILLVNSSCVLAQDEAQEADPNSTQPALESPVDISHRMISSGLDGFAQWVDSFFDDERFIAEDAATRLRVRQEVFLEYDENIEYKTGGSISFKVPKFSNRLRLFVAGEESNERIAAESVIDPTDEDRDEGALGLQYFSKASDTRNLSLTAGIKLESTDFFVGPRYRHTFDFDSWQLRFIQRIRWFTRKKWESTTRLDYERLLGENLLFRHTVDGRWREEDDGYRYSVTPALIQRLAKRKAVEYQLNNVFVTSPNHRLDQSVARIRFRQNVLRKWLFLETNPQIAFRNDDDYEPKAGLVIQLEVVFGGRD